MKSEKKLRFILSRQNQKGQVAVFVALIFQVVFVFFAMLINVGLLVHHKINLQQSTDLAAYYGAMKQAEILNVMAHVNYQIRQSWKLFTWRYRVLGTFGVERKIPPLINPTDAPILPVGWEKTDSEIVYNEGQYKCPSGKSAGINFTDVPFACMGHVGFADWPSPDGGSETFCRIDCNTMGAVPTTINKLSGVGNFKALFGNIGGDINKGIKVTNNNLAKQCGLMGSTTAAMLGLFYINYFNDTKNKKRIISLLNKNLAQDENNILDIEGNKVITGIENTLKNNLTEANFSSMTKSSITTFNGTKAFDDKLIREITLYYLNFFIFDCKNFTGGKGSISPSLNNLNNNVGDGLEPNSELIKNLKVQFGDSAAQTFIDMFANNSKDVNTLGFEKNPYINVYYGVKATSEPRIPFLPLSKIKLNAISFAKPFGGTIGPWYYNKWSPGSPQSTLTSFENGRTDLTLPAQTAQDAGLGDDLKSLKDSVKVTPNFSLYVGDRSGLSDSKYLGIYQGILASRKIPNENVSANEKISHGSKILETEKVGLRAKAKEWPKMKEWSHLTKVPTDTNDFDSLAINQDNPNQYTNTFMRDIEITVVAPNQFDTAYYSIEPNFFQVYGKGKLLDKNGVDMDGLRKIANAVGENPSEIAFPHDFGSTVNTKIAGLAREFNVSRQLQVVTELFATSIGDIKVKNIQAAASMFFTFIPRNPAALLSGWTYNDPRTYSKFPEPSQDKAPYTMQYGSCNDDRGAGNENVYSSISEADPENQPATPGNCVTGGRTGYSVKLISSDLVRKKTEHKDLGGPGTGSSPIANPVDENFLKF